MPKLIKIILGLLVSIFALLVIVILALPMLIDVNDFKQDIEQQALKQTGQKLTIDGNIDLSFSLPLSVSFDLGATRFDNAEAFQQITDKPFAMVKQLSIKAALMPLLQEKRLEIGKIILDGVNLNLYKNEQGKANWETLNQGEKAPDGSNTDNTESKTNELPIKSVHIAGVELINTSITYVDKSTEQEFALNDFNILISEVAENKPVEIKMNTQLFSKKPQLNADLQLSSTLIVDLLKSQFDLNNISLKLSSKGDVIPGGSNSTELSASAVNFNLAGQTLKLSDLKLSSYDINITGKTEVNNLFSSADFKGKLSIAEFSPKQLTKTLGITLAEMKNDQVLEKFAIDMTYSGNKNKFEMSELKSYLDEIKIEGYTAINNFANPSYDVKVNINQLHLDDYAVKTEPAKTAPQTDKKPLPSQPASSEQAQLPMIPVDVLRKLNMNAELTIAEILASGVKLENVVLKLKADQGLVELNPVKSDFYQGKLNLSTQVDVRGKQPEINLNQDFNQIDLGQLLLDATGTEEFTGTANIKSKLTTSGNTQQQFTKNLNGQSDFLITDGHIKKLDILHTIRKAQVLLKGQQLATQAQEENTAFTEMKGKLNIVNGLVKNQDLYAKTPLMEISGKGYADLPKEYLDYTLKVKVLNSLKIDDKSDGTDFRGKIIPYTIKGKFNELSQQADVQQIVKDQVKEQVKEKVQKEINKKLGDQFKGLFKF